MNSNIQLTPKKRAFLTGTILLTGTGFACRLLGFFYRIFLSRTIGAEGLGLYNIVHPVFGICFALCAGSIQTALSQYIAAHMEKGRSVFRVGLCISMALSFILAFLICRHSDFLATYILMEPRCAPFLPIMGISVPFAALHACINGYYYGTQKAKVPAFSQVAEQIIRMVCVFLLADAWMAAGNEITVHLAVIGHLVGEIASAIFTFFCLCFFPPQARIHSKMPAVRHSFNNKQRTLHCGSLAPYNDVGAAAHGQPAGAKRPSQRRSHLDSQPFANVGIVEFRSIFRLWRAYRYGSSGWCQDRE